MPSEPNQQNSMDAKPKPGIAEGLFAAYEALPHKEQQHFLRLLEDAHDAAVVRKRRHEPRIPLEHYLARRRPSP